LHFGPRRYARGRDPVVAKATTIEREEIMTRSTVAFLGVALAVGVLSAPAGASVVDFYKGNKIQILVGTTPGAGYDLIARLLAAHFGKHVAGNPSIIVENMPGAGSLSMINHLYNRAARDGTVMGLPLNGILLEPTLKVLSRAGGAANFDVSKMSWIGSTSEEPQVLWVRSDSKVRTVNDLRTMEAVVGASAPGADNLTIATLTNRLLGTRMNVVRGYGGTQPVFLAAERGEVDGSATAYGAIVVARGDWLRDKKIRLLIQYGLERIPDLADVPTAIELTDNADAKAMLGAFAIKFKAAYPFVLPPAVPADRVGALRAAFGETMKDPEFLAAVGKAGFKLKPVSGPEIETLLESTYKIPQPLLDGLRKLIEG
jgi:tripartite-type tricarboxylate transporter receptor subunit TctC